VRLYRYVNDIIAQFGGRPCAPLRDLAAITNFSLFVSTTPDRMLADAVNDVRFGGRRRTRELVFAPNQSTEDQARNLHTPAESDTTILQLFGQAVSTPQYAVHDEDLLEWLHALLTDTGSLPDEVAEPLRRRPLLFIGCDIPDWLGRFLLRLSCNTRISLENKQFFFVGRPATAEPKLTHFFSTYCGRTQVQHLAMAPEEFVAELQRRVATRSPHQDRALTPVGSRSSNAPTIFISYLREDIDHVRRLSDHIAGMGGDVWLDERRLWPGDYWEDEILRAIRKQVRLFLPIISANTEHEEEGYVFREWKEAVKRAGGILRRRFIIPIIVDDSQDDVSTYRMVPEEFHRYNFGFAPTGEPDTSLRSMLVEEIRAMRRAGAS
jgi:hypothetical protein